MTTDRPPPDDKDEAARQLSAWILAHTDIESLPELIAWLEIAKPKSVVERLMAALTRHRRRQMVKSDQKD